MKHERKIYDQQRKEKYYELNDTVNFGKYRGCTIEYLVDNHPDYVNWMIENKDWFVLSNKAYKYYEQVLNGIDIRDDKDYPVDWNFGEFYKE